RRSRDLRPGQPPGRQRRATRSRPRALRRGGVLRLSRPPPVSLTEFLDQAFELFQQRVCLPPALLDQVGKHLLGVAARHPAALDRVVDDLLQTIAAQGDAALEAVPELLDALVEARG